MKDRIDSGPRGSGPAASFALPATDDPAHARLRRWILVACGAFMIFSVAPYFPPLAPNRWPYAFKLYVYSLVALGQAGILLAASRRRELGRRLRQAILLLAAGMFLVAISDPMAAVLRQRVTGPALHDINDFLELAYSLLGLAGLLWMPLAPLRRNGRWLVALDIAIAVGGMAIVLFVTTTLVGLSAADPASRSRILEYGLITAGNLVALNLILVRGLARPVPLAVSFLAATAVIEIGYWVLAQLSIGNIVADMRPIDVLFGVDQVCYAVAGLSFLTAPVEPGRRALAPAWLREINPLPAIAIVAVGVLLTQRVLSDAKPDLRIGVLGLVALSVLLVVRVTLAAHDRSTLVRQEIENEQRLHADRVMAIRRLAGGIAHEFNNQLAVVLGTVELEVRDLAPQHPVREGLEDIRAAAESASGLTQRLLAYAGDSRAERARVPVLGLMSGVRERVQDACGRGVTVHFDFSKAAGDVKVERGLIEECVLHLVRNASDAMPDGGDLLIRLDRERVPHGGLNQAILPPPPGDYAVIEVRDSGDGIAPGDVQRIFDPFFTSRSSGPSAGLGLAVVHGAVASHGGGITVSSARGGGAVIRLYLPAETGTPTA